MLTVLLFFSADVNGLNFMPYVGVSRTPMIRRTTSYRFRTLSVMQRFARVVLDRYRLQPSDIKDALQKIASAGDLSALFGLLQADDVRTRRWRDRFQGEEHHRDSFYYALPKNPILLPDDAEFLGRNAHTA
jgi:hypothetical protein